MKKILLFLLITFSLSATPRTVVFDFGEVLAFPNPNLVLQFLCKTFSISPKEAEQVYQKQFLLLPRSAGAEKRFWHQFASQKGILLPPHWFQTYQETVRASLDIQEDMFCMIEELKQKKIQVGLLSNVTKPKSKILRRFGLYKPFNPCLLSCDIGIRKPDPKAFLLLLKKIKFSPQEIVFIDNSLENVLAAKKEGLDAIVFASSQQIHQELKKRGLVLEKSAERLKACSRCLTLP